VPRRSKTDQELGYVDAFWREVKTFQAAYGVAFQMEVHLSERPGVLVFRLTSTSLLSADGESMGKDAVQFEFPNSSVQSLAGAIWLYSVKLHNLVTERDERKPRRRSKAT